jgi:hypothetical protein
VKVLPTKIYTPMHSGEKHMAKYEKTHDMKVLPSKIKALDVLVNKSDPLTHKRVMHENIINLRSKVKAEFKPPKQIQPTKTPRDKKFVIQNQRPNLNMFSSNSGANIPVL